ncbi:HNH endonuclease signature motif containing protein [Mycolicibacterium neoaurum]|uniref:HNH endonuclease signature motif containing protein n=1 Tax=Mycolicibacterium neoaurum TaxID=1795 RepID=UPI00248CDBAC|nr:HNH endonuclease signature motif containing protein [Mycolicibacterium neoaurum]WBP92792.1 HNH endonuclease signature motif containing protein [Mycolicibacterium neoaurum]WBS06354.1 HNH endonuclease signature motif containing protein [Mycolicibacterium neoaurum]
MKTNKHSGWDWNRLRKAKCEQNQRDNGGQCQAVLDGCEGVATEVHHVIERAAGGTDDDENLLAVCGLCHYRLTTEANQRRAKQRRQAKQEAKRKNHPGRKDRYDS